MVYVRNTSQMNLRACLPLHHVFLFSEGRFQGLVFHSESTECRVHCQKRSVIANETLAWQVLDNFPGLLLLHIQFYYFLKWGNSVWRVQRDWVSCCRKVWLFSPCRLFTFADNAYLGLSCVVGMPYINWYSAGLISRTRLSYITCGSREHVEGSV